MKLAIVVLVIVVIVFIAGAAFGSHDPGLDLKSPDWIESLGSVLEKKIDAGAIQSPCFQPDFKQFKVPPVTGCTINIEKSTVTYRKLVLGPLGNGVVTADYDPRDDGSSPGKQHITVAPSSASPPPKDSSLIILKAGGPVVLRCAGTMNCMAVLK